MAFNFAMFSRTKLDTHAPLVPDYTICEFQSGTKCVLRLYDFSLHHTQTKVSLGLKTGLNSFRNDLYGNKISSRYHVNRCKEIYVDGMNLLRNEIYSGFM